ncbi:MAG: AsmA family protein, partial [Bacteroidia bacterium]
MGSRYSIFKRVVWGTVFGIVFLIGTAVLLSYVFEDKIKGLAIKEVNKVLVAKVEIKGSDINFSFLKHFPLASISFDNFIVKDPIGDGDLARAKSLSVQFNPFDILFGKYEIKKILLKDATLNLRINKHGKPNYIIWKVDTTTIDETPFALQLNNISLLRVKVNYDDIQSTLTFGNDIKEAFLTGKLYDDKFLLAAKADIYFSRFSMNKTQYIKHQRIIFDAALDMDMLQQKYTIKEGLATINHAEFDVTGFAQNLSNSVKIDYTIKSKQNKIQTLMALMPEEYASLFKDYESEGAVYFTAKIKGLISDVENPAVNVNFGVKNGRLVDKVNNIALEKLN